MNMERLLRNVDYDCENNMNMLDYEILLLCPIIFMD